MNYQYYGNPYYPQEMPAQQMQMRQQPTPVAPQNGVQWVSGEQEARNWMIAPNSAVTLWDSNSPSVYLKQTDAAGKPTFTIYDLVERAPKPPANVAAEFVTRKEFEELAAMVSKLGKAGENG